MSFKLGWDGEALKHGISSMCAEVVRESAETLADEIRQKIPVSKGTPKKTEYREAGQHIRDSIRVNTWEDKGRAVGAYITVGYPYLGYIATFVELGTPGTRKRTSGGGIINKKGGRIRTQLYAPRTPIQAKPFMRPALKKFRRRFLARFEGILK